MAWVKLDDGFSTHPKVAALSDRAFRVAVAAFCWSSQQATDGQIPRAVAQRVLGATAKVVGELVAAGMWDPSPGGWLVHDWTDWQRSAETVKREREATRERVKRWRGDADVTPLQRPYKQRSNGDVTPMLRTREVEVEKSKPSSSSVDLENPLVAREAETAKPADEDGYSPGQDPRIEAAIDILVDQAEQAKRARGEAVNNPPAWRRKVADDKRDEHGPTIAALADEHPDWTPAALAALVAPPAPQEQTSTEGRPQPPMIEHQPWCPECEHEHFPWADHWTPPTDGTAGLTPGTPEFIEARRAHRLAQGATREDLMRQAGTQ